MNEITKTKRSLNPVQSYVAANNIHKQLASMLGKRSSQFLISLNNAYEDYLKNCTPATIVKSAMDAAALDLPIEKNLGFAYLVPYKNSCQFQLGYKGYIQLAQRSGKYTRINATPIYKEWFVSFNPLTEELELDFSKEADYSDEPIGYCAYFKLQNGFEKTVYWTKSKCENHAKKYSKSYAYKNKAGNIWHDNKEAMFLKTVLKQALSKFGILSIEMQKAFDLDVENSKNDSINNLTDVNEVSAKNILGIEEKINQETGEIQDIQDIEEIERNKNIDEIGEIFEKDQA